MCSALEKRERSLVQHTYVLFSGLWKVPTAQAND